jgi:hypothetical protein
LSADRLYQYAVAAAPSFRSPAAGAMLRVLAALAARHRA